MEISDEMVARAYDVLCEVAAVPPDWVRRALAAALDSGAWDAAVDYVPNEPPPSPLPTLPSTTTHPVFDGVLQTGTVLVTKVAEGYEARCYKPPPDPQARSGVPVPLADMVLLWAALYDDDGVCVRLLDG